MDDLRRMAVFASVVQHGSMTGAARLLGMSPSAVSQQVRLLERDLQRRGATVAVAHPMEGLVGRQVQAGQHTVGFDAEMAGHAIRPAQAAAVAHQVRRVQ
jgi:DNA-binding transcriptional regulator YdaS (Cro superfamily)